MDNSFQLIQREQPEMTLFRIIPDRSVSNNQNRKLWRLIHDLMSLDHSFRSRLRREGFRLYYKLRDNIYFDIVMRCEEEEVENDGETEIIYNREILFFFCVPTNYARVIKQKIHDKHPKLTIQEVDFSEVAVPEGATVTDYRYTRHDAFSLRVNDAEQSSPLSSILNTAYDMQGDDYARLSFQLERVDRQHWRRQMDHAWSKLDKKKVPLRARADIGLLFRSMGDIFRFLSYEGKSIIEDILDGFGSVFGKGKMLKDERKGFDHQNAEYAKMFLNGDLSLDTKKKRFDSPFKVGIRLAVQSEDRTRAHLIQHGITNAFNELAQPDNALQPHTLRVKIQGKAIEEMNTFTRILSRDKDPNILSCKEIGKFNQYPTADLQTQFGELLEATARIETDIPKTFRDTSGLLVGHAAYRGEEIPIYVPVGKGERDMDTFMMPRVFIGSPRMGKDTALVNWMVEAARKGFGGVVLDVVCEEGNTRGLADSLRDALPPERLIDLDAANTEYPFYIGLNEVMSRAKNAGNKLANDFAMIFEVEDNGRTRTYLREAIKACDGDLLGVRLLLMSDGVPGDYLDEKIKTLRKDDKLYAAEFWDAYRQETRGQKSEIRKPILSRLDEIFGDDHLKNMFGQKVNPDIDFAKWLKEGKIIIIRMPNGHPDMSEPTVKTLAQWLVLKTFYTKLAMNDKECCSFLVLNEPHQFLSPGLVKVLGRMLRESPKWRLSLLFSLHDFTSKTAPKEMIDAMFAASVNWHVFKNTDLTVYTRLKHLLASVYTPEEAQRQTPEYHSINLFLQKGEYCQPFLMQTLDVANKRYTPHDNFNITSFHSRKYGRSRKTVEAEIFDLEKQLFRKKAAK